MISLFFNIQPKKWNLPHQGGHESNGGTTYTNLVGLVKGDVVATPEVEMQGTERSGRRGSSRKGGGSSRRKGSSIRGGSYAPVNGDVDWNGNGGNHGVHGMDSEEEVDLGLVREERKGKGWSRVCAWNRQGTILCIYRR